MKRKLSNEQHTISPLKLRNNYFINKTLAEFIDENFVQSVKNSEFA